MNSPSVSHASPFASFIATVCWPTCLLIVLILVGYLRTGIDRQGANLDKAYVIQVLNVEQMFLGTEVPGIIRCIANTSAQEPATRVIHFPSDAMDVPPLSSGTMSLNGDRGTGLGRSMYVPFTNLHDF